MLHNNTKVDLRVYKVANGFVIEWETRRPKKRPNWVGSMSSPDDDDIFDPRGIEIFSKQSDAIKRIKQLLDTP